MPIWSDDSIFLGERHLGFSKRKLGFPSISACRAIVYQNETGIFGFHHLDGVKADRFAEFGRTFADFVHQHPNGGGAGVAMFAAAKLGDGGGYFSGDRGEIEHQDEMKAFAHALNFHGKFYTYDLSTKWGKPGVYVEFKKEGKHWVMYGNAWKDYHNPKDEGPVHARRRLHHKQFKRGQDGYFTPVKVLRRVPLDGREKLNPIPLPM